MNAVTVLLVLLNLWGLNREFPYVYGSIRAMLWIGAIVGALYEHWGWAFFFLILALLFD